MFRGGIWFVVTISAVKRPSASGSWRRVMIQEGEESDTTNLRQKCYNESLKAKEDEPLTKWQWHEFVEKKAHRGRLWKMIGKEQYVREMWEYFCKERDKAKRFREQVEEEWQAGIRGQWQLESPAKECLEQVKCCNDTYCTERMMKHGFFALESGDWENMKTLPKGSESQGMGL